MTKNYFNKYKYNDKKRVVADYGIRVFTKPFYNYHDFNFKSDNARKNFIKMIIKKKNFSSYEKFGFK